MENSPDAVQATKRGLINSLQHGGVEEAYLAAAWSPETKQAYAGENIKVRCFQYYDSLLTLVNTGGIESVLGSTSLIYLST